MSNPENEKSFFTVSNPGNEKYLADFVEKARLFDTPMATTTRYHLLPDDNRPSEDENAAENERLISASIHSLHSNPASSNQRFQCSGHATIYSRLAVICLLIPAFVIMALPGTPQTLPIEILGMICIVRNAWVLMSQFISPRIRIHVEIVGSSPSLPINKPSIRPQWLTRRYMEMAIDMLVWIPLFIATTVIGSRLGQCNGTMFRGPWYVCNNRAFVPGIILSWLACGLYLFSIIDGGKPRTFTASAGFIFDEEKAPSEEVPSLLARGGLAVGTERRKTGADSPVIV